MRRHVIAGPYKYTKKRLTEIAEYVDAYTKRTEIPSVAGVALELDMPRETLYRYDELQHSIRMLITKKEAQLEALALRNEISVTMAIFSLKQLGWKDKQEVEHSGEINQIVIKRHGTDEANN